MKTILLLLTLLFLVCPAGSQNPVVTAEVSSVFMVNGTMLPAGHYQVIPDSQLAFLTIRNTDSGQTVRALFRSVKENCADTEFILAPDNDRQVLHRVCRAGDKYAFDLVHETHVTSPVLPE